MNVLDSNFEALAFDYVRVGIFTVVNNLWTWVALVTAAVSFWRIKTAAVKTESSSDIYVVGDSKNDDSPVAREASQTESTTSPIRSFKDTPSSSSRPPVSENGDSVTKGKFVMYYEDERLRENNGQGDEQLTVVGEWGYGDGEWTERLALRMRMEEKGWYRCQDLTVISGNVVRLWEGVNLVV